MTPEELKKTSKEQLINLAIAKIEEPSFQRINFDRIQVKISKEDICVHFAMSIRFVPIGKEYYYDLAVYLCSNRSGRNTLSNDCKESPFPHTDFYIPSEEDRKAIQFVINSINKSDRIGHIPDGDIGPGNTMTIYDKGLYYDIKVDSDHQGSFYKIEKATGRIYDDFHCHYIPSPSPYEWEEIL